MVSRSGLTHVSLHAYIKCKKLQYSNLPAFFVTLPYEIDLLQIHFYYFTYYSASILEESPENMDGT